MSTIAKEVTAEQALGMKAAVALLHVADVERSVGFYQKLGFELGKEPAKNEQGTASFAGCIVGSRRRSWLR